MKRSSVINFCIVLTLFGIIQGWVLYSQFIKPASIKTTQAYLTGQSVAVGTPVSGIIKSVNVTEGKHVEKGQPLFLISQQAPLESSGETPIAVVAQQSGTVYNIEVTANSFVQASQILAHIVDTDPKGLFVEATLSVTPEQFSSITPSRLATVQGALLNNGDPVPSVITSVDLYDGSKHTVDVRLRLLADASVPNVETILKLPVEVTIVTGQQEKIALNPESAAAELPPASR